MGPALGIHPCSLSHKDGVDRRSQVRLVVHMTLLFVGSCKELMWILGGCPEKGNGMVLSLFFLCKVQLCGKLGSSTEHVDSTQS